MEKSEFLHKIEDATGLDFVYVPEGTYGVGADPHETRMATTDPYKKSATKPGKGVCIPASQVAMPSFWISSDLVRHSHWQRLSASSLAASLASFTQEEIADYQRNLVAEHLYPEAKPCLREFIKDKVEADPALALKFERSAIFARSIGLEIPNFLQWEVAARGAQGYLFPWGDVLDLARLRLSNETYCTWEDPESTMGMGRDTDHALVHYVDSFGDYQNARSPFGLSGLVHWGMEWNARDAACDKIYAFSSPILRSLCNLQFNETIIRCYNGDALNQRAGSKAHRNFMGTTLAMFAQPAQLAVEWMCDGKQRAAFRLAYCELHGVPALISRKLPPPPAPPSLSCKSRPGVAGKLPKLPDIKNTLKTVLRIFLGILLLAYSLFLTAVLISHMLPK